MTALSKSINEGAPAFPGVGAGRWWAGMSLRDYFAAQAMQGLIQQVFNNGNSLGKDFKEENTGLAIAAYTIADAMLEARK